MRGRTSAELKLPPSALRLLVRVLAELGQGHAITLTPLRAELTTQQAADLLNVSRPHLVKLLDAGAMPSRKVGSHRRVLLSDPLAYREAWHAKRHAALDELAALSQDVDMGYRLAPCAERNRSPLQGRTWRRRSPRSRKTRLPLGRQGRPRAMVRSSKA